MRKKFKKYADRDNHIMIRHPNYFVQRWTDMVFGDTSIDNLLMLSNDHEKDHIDDLLKSSDDEMDADDSVIILDSNEEDRFSGGLQHHGAAHMDLDTEVASVQCH